MFTGSITALVTPFSNGKIDEPALRALIERQITEGSHGIVPVGTTGESATLNIEEHVRVIEITVDQVKKRIPVIAGTGANSTAEAIELHQKAHKAGVDGSLQVTPYYNKPPQEGLYQHFKAVAASCDLPILLYTVPGRTGVNMLPETVARLSQIDVIVGVKEASGNLDQIKKILELCPKEFVVLSGEDAQTLQILKMGGQGAISVTANVVPGDCAKEYNDFKAGKIKEAESIHEKLLPLHDSMFLEANPIPVKAALSMMGLIKEEYRLPLVKISESSREKLKKALLDYGVKLK